MKRTLDEIGMYAMAAKPHMQLLGTTKKNQALEAVANALNEKADYLIAENEKDMQAGKEAGMQQGNHTAGICKGGQIWNRKEIPEPVCGRYRGTEK